MALGTNLTLRDYLKIPKIQGPLTSQKGHGEFNAPDGCKDFEKMLETVTSSDKKTGLTFSDYLANPVNRKPTKITSQNSSTFETESENCLSGKNMEKTHQSMNDAHNDALSVNNIIVKNSERRRIEDHIQKAASKYSLSPDLIRGVIRAESGFQVRAVSRAGAQGLMQLMPATAEELGVDDSFDVGQNIDGGAKYLRNMLDRFENNTEKALSAYNAGPGTVEKYNGDVPYKETRKYVKRVMEYAGLSA